MLQSMGVAPPGGLQGLQGLMADHGDACMGLGAAMGLHPR